jgi:cell division protease FtsH
MLLFAMQLVMNPGSQERPITYTTFERQMEDGNLAEVTVIDSREIRGRLLEPQVLPLESGANEEVEKFVTTLPFSDPELVERIATANPDTEIRGETSGVNWWGAVLTYLPFILLIGIWLFFLRQMQSGGNRAFSFGKSKAKLVNADRPQVTFADVAGCEEAKADLEEIIEFLKSPRRERGRPYWPRPWPARPACPSSR